MTKNMRHRIDQGYLTTGVLQRGSKEMCGGAAMAVITVGHSRDKYFTDDLWKAPIKSQGR